MVFGTEEKQENLNTWQEISSDEEELDTVVSYFVGETTIVVLQMSGEKRKQNEHQNC